MGPEDAKTLREPERDMMAFFSDREIGEGDKRCWMIDHGYATVEQDQVSVMRYGGLMKVECTGKGTDRYGEKK